jgi:hypothetical protein
MMRRNMGRLIGRLGLDVNDINLLDGSLLTDDKILRQTIWLRNISSSGPVVNGLLVLRATACLSRMIRLLNAEPAGKKPDKSKNTG